MTDSLKTLYEDLQNRQDEDDIRSRLRELLSQMDKGDYSLEYSTGNGPADMVCHQYKVLIETKSRGKCDPLNPGSKEGETQQDQVKRYLAAMSEPTLFDNQEEENTGWRGFLTDGVLWWGWDYNYETGSLIEIDFKGNHNCKNLNQFASFATEYLAPEKRRGMPAPPDPLLPLFERPLERLQKLQQGVEGQPHYDTKFAIWKDILEGSGLISDSPLRMSANFAQHTILVIASRIIVATANDGIVEEEMVLEALEEGFCGWPLESREGRQIIKDLISSISGYDWQAADKDLLKGLYHDLIPKEDRKEFGEYYTPDWLAEWLVSQVLDSATLDDIIEIAAKRLNSPSDSDALGSHIVLDPSCGSGTFLFHAAVAIRSRIRNHFPHLLSESREIIASTVQGFDIHPIAVEMSRATLSTALPPASDSNARDMELRCFVADSLYTSRLPQASLHGLEITAPNGHIVHISNELLTSPYAYREIGKLVDSAISVADAPANESPAGELRPLVSAIREMGNHVWKWYISNQVGPAHLAEQKARVIVGNPPWLVMNDTKNGARKDSIKKLRTDYGLKPTVRSSASGDLASVFSARTVDLFLAENGKFGFVLPGSALINQTWENWRGGTWRESKIRFDIARNLDNLSPPPFDHAPNGTCTVTGRKAPSPERLNQWHKYSGDFQAPVGTLEGAPTYEAFHYSRNVAIGAQAKPIGLLIGNRPLDTSKVVKFATFPSTKPPWKGVRMNSEIEAESLIPLLRSQQLTSFGYTVECVLVAPMHSDGKRLLDTLEPVTPGERRVYSIWRPEDKERLPFTWGFWDEANRMFLEGRSKYAGASLTRNLNYNNTLQKQLAYTDTTLRKVCYNASGNNLRASRIPENLVVNHKLYWRICSSEMEAAYLTALLNVDVLQAAWRASKTSKVDYDTKPLKYVPVPEFNPTEQLHIDIAACTVEAETTGPSPPGLSKLVVELLPKYCTEM